MVRERASFLRYREGGKDGGKTDHDGSRVGQVESDRGCDAKADKLEGSGRAIEAVAATDRAVVCSGEQGRESRDCAWIEREEVESPVRGGIDGEGAGGDREAIWGFWADVGE
jgi:hypothetical protein